MCSLRVSEVITHILNFLLDMGILNAKKRTEGTTEVGSAGGTSAPAGEIEAETKTEDLGDNSLKSIELFLAVVIR